MSTPFNTSFNNGDVIQADHVKQYAEPIQELESGAALFRVASNDSGAYSVDFKASANPNGHRITSLSQGQMIVFKASHNSPASATLRVLLEPSGSASHPLTMGDTQVGANDILQNQMVIVVYNATTTPRFDVIGIASGGALSELEDVTFTSLATGQLLRYNGTAWVNAALAASDLPSGIDAAKIGGGTVSNAEFGYLDGVTSSIQTQLNGKAATSHTHTIANVTNLQTSLDAKQNTSAKNAANGYAGLDASSKLANAQMSEVMPLSGLSDVAITSPATGHTVRYNGTSFVNAALSPGDVGAAPASHTHAAGDITSGTLPVDRGGTGLSSIAANRLLGTGSTANVAQAITVGTGLSLSGGTLSNTVSAGVTGSGSGNRLALWSGSNSLTSSSGIYRSGDTLYASGIHSTNSTYYTPSGRFYAQNLGNSGGGVSTYWNSSTKELFYQYSRGAHKKDVKSITTTIEQLMSWRAVEFTWKDSFGGEEDIGLIAEEVASAFPRAAFYDQDWEYVDERTGKYTLNEDGTPKKLPGPMVPAGVKYEKAWVPMLAAVQDFYRLFLEEKAKTARLEARLSVLENSSR